MQSYGFKIDKLETQMDQAGCSFWEALFTFGACVKGKSRKLEIVKINTIYVREIKIASNLNKKMLYVENSSIKSFKLSGIPDMLK